MAIIMLPYAKHLKEGRRGRGGGGAMAVSCKFVLEEPQAPDLGASCSGVKGKLPRNYRVSKVAFPLLLGVVFSMCKRC